MSSIKVTQLLPICIFLVTANLHSARALDLLPYSTRTHTYSAWSTAARGDLRTVGMSGATVGLADTFIAALDNPAGLAMTLNGIDANFTTNFVYDGNIQSFDKSKGFYDFGIASDSYPWGFSIGLVSNAHES